MLAQEIVVEADDRLAGAAIALARRTAVELAIDPRALVELGEDDMEPAQGLDGALELDVGTAPGHVGRHRDATAPAGLRDDGSLLRILPGIEHAMGQAGRIEFG